MTDAVKKLPPPAPLNSPTNLIVLDTPASKALRLKAAEEAVEALVDADEPVEPGVVRIALRSRPVRAAPAQVVVPAIGVAVAAQLGRKTTVASCDQAFIGLFSISIIL